MSEVGKPSHVGWSQEQCAQLHLLPLRSTEWTSSSFSGELCRRNCSALSFYLQLWQSWSFWVFASKEIQIRIRSPELMTPFSRQALAQPLPLVSWKERLFPCQVKVRECSSLAHIACLFHSPKPNHCYRFTPSHSLDFLMREISSHGKQWLPSHMGSCLTHTAGFWLCFMKPGRDARVTLRLRSLS